MLHASSVPESERILIHAPYGRDAELIQRELLSAGFLPFITGSVEGLCAEMALGAAAVLVGDEVLTAASVQCLAEVLAHQPPWSDFPLLVMTSGGASTAASRYRLSLLEPLGNVALLERPLRPVTLVSSLRAALRARRHQYQLCRHLTHIAQNEQALRQSEARFRFLSDLGESIRAVARPEDVTAKVARLLGEHLQVSRCAYATVESDSEHFTILDDYTAPGVVSTAGTYLLSLFGPRATADMRAGRTLVVHDVDGELAPGEGGSMFSALGIKAIICCPLVKEGRLAAMMAVHQNTPRTWTEDDLELVEEVVERCWAYIERERLVVQLAENNSVLQQTNQDLTRVNRELEEFAYVASHDLQEPLRMVRIYTQMILRHLGDSDPTLQEFGEFVRQGAARMEELIRDLLTFSRAVHTESPSVGSADLNEALAEAVAVLQNRIEENGAVIEAEPLPLVRGDASQFSHVFQNLISNSIKYRKSDQPPRIAISVKAHEDEAILSVADNGIGFDQQYAQRIFGLFKRLHKDEYPGTGLGLAICQRIVERYGGRMWAESRLGRGATFYVALPRHELPS